ncbi:hypothetical protein [Paenibacillus motobuensis]|uniref:Uncharacterized protein n=1 Tax=Paenibacillus motobuensis TaxID=295324 RepID=A0ABN0XW25_9BACL
MFNSIHEVSVIETETGRIASNFKFEADNFTFLKDIAVNNDGVIVGCYDNYVQVYNLNGGIISKINVKAEAIAFHPENQNIVAIGTIDGVQLWDITSGSTTSTNWDVYKGDKRNKELQKIEFSLGKDPKILLFYVESGSLSDDGDMLILNPLTGVTGPIYHEIRYPSLSEDGSKIIYNKNEYIKIANVEDGRALLEQKCDSKVADLAFSPSGLEFISAFTKYQSVGCIPISEMQCSIMSYSITDGSQIGKTFEGCIASQYGVKIFTPNNDTVLTVSRDDKEVLIWGKKDVRVLKHVNLQRNTGSLKQHRISTDKRLLVILSQDLIPDSLLHPENVENLGDLGRSEAVNNFVSTNLTDVTNDLIKSLSWPALAIAGFSEYTLLDGLALSLHNRIGTRYLISGFPDLSFGITPSHLEETRVFADASIKKIGIKLPLFLDLYTEKDNCPLRLSRTRINLKIFAQPSVKTFDADVAQSLQLEFENAEPEGKSSTHIIYPAIAIPILGSEEKLIDFIESAINELINGSGPIFAYYLDSLIMDSPMPQSWNQVNEYEFIFRGFSYKPVEVITTDDKLEVGYLFLVFSVVSHNLPPKCVCRDDVISLLSLNNSSQSDKRRYFSLAFSEDSLNVLAGPHRNSGDSKSRTKGGGMYYTVKAYYTTQLNRLELNNDQLEAEVTVKGGGGITLGIRLKRWGVEFLSIKDSASLHLSFKNVMTTWKVSVLSNFPEKDITSIVLEPKVIIDRKDIKVELDTSLNNRLDGLLSSALDWLVTEIATTIAPVIQAVAHIELVYDIYNNKEHDYHISNASSKVYNDSSLIITAEIDACLPQ